MHATSNFSLRFDEPSESKLRIAERLLTRQTLARLAAKLSLISQALGFSIFGTLTCRRRFANANNRIG